LSIATCCSIRKHTDRPATLSRIDAAAAYIYRDIQMRELNANLANIEENTDIEEDNSDPLILPSMMDGG
jgi:hypothetical protein